MYIAEGGAASGEASAQMFLPYDVKPKKGHIQRTHRANTKAKQLRLFVSSTFV
jgi:hypothetical protein